MKKFIDGVMIVEGNHDASMISSFFDVDIVITNGYDIPKTELEYLQSIQYDHTIFCLVDPDEAGNKIRKKLHDNISKMIDINLDINWCDKKGKHGVAECDRKKVFDTIYPFCSNNARINTISSKNLYELGLIGGVDSKNLRNYICTRFALGLPNGKSLLKRLNFKGITIKELKETIKEYGNK